MDFNPTTSGSAISLSSPPDYTTCRWGAGLCPIEGTWIGQGLVAGYYRIYRTALVFDTSAIGTTPISSATLSFTSGYLAAYTCSLTNGSFVVPLVDSDYLLMRDTNTIYGSVDITSSGDKQITLSAAGLAYINTGGETQFCLKGYNDVTATAPTGREYSGVSSFVLSIETTYSTSAGYLWVESTKLHYTDEDDGTERADEGTAVVGGSGVAGHLWTEGNNLHYIDENGDERYLTGTDTTVNGTAGHIWTATTYLYFIDSSGNIRRYEGTAV